MRQVRSLSSLELVDVLHQRDRQANADALRDKASRLAYLKLLHAGTGGPPDMLAYVCQCPGRGGAAYCCSGRYVLDSESAEPGSVRVGCHSLATNSAGLGRATC